MPRAPSAAGTTSEQTEGIRSQDFAKEDNELNQYESNRVDFTGDGLNTGVRVRGSSAGFFFVTGAQTDQAHHNGTQQVMDDLIFKSTSGSQA